MRFIWVILLLWAALELGSSLGSGEAGNALLWGILFFFDMLFMIRAFRIHEAKRLLNNKKPD